MPKFGSIYLQHTCLKIFSHCFSTRQYILISSLTRMTGISHNKTKWKMSIFGVFLVRIQSKWENADQKNSEYGHFSRSVSIFFYLRHYRMTFSYKAKTNISLPATRNYMQKLNTASIWWKCFQRNIMKSHFPLLLDYISLNRVQLYFFSLNSVPQWPQYL